MADTKVLFDVHELEKQRKLAATQSELVQSKPAQDDIQKIIEQIEEFIAKNAWAKLEKLPDLTPKPVSVSASGFGLFSNKPENPTPEPPTKKPSGPNI